ncbi:signal transduction histidine kinase [Thermocatellispora tengchongensis]|uniref:Signal transduction histidine kinase n=1 Tax=Thermocatellispora tengchongensis TaxID=1073253 RepID=A0A840PAS6_9ACTN|nr:histidine kinase [Thermocatellispora tengchongensis]MBB5136109.1 signal transduction histidine kinase [Thermocatellispora tengchongensis]
MAILAGDALVTVINVLAANPGPARLTGFAVCLFVVFSLQLFHSLGRPWQWPVRTRVASLSLQALASYLPFLWVGGAWGGMLGFLGGSVLLAVQGRAKWPLYLAVAAAIVPALAAYDMTPVMLAYGVGFTMLTGLVVYGISSLSTLVAELYAARDGLARMAVTRERLRVARDLHDLLGYSLSAITLKSELTYRLLPAQPHRAREEVTDILTVARQALADVRTVADGYRAMSLGVEVQSAQSILAAAGIEVRAEVSTPGLPVGVETVLATVLREAITNVLRHSKAQNVMIRADVAGGVVRLRVANDGVDRDAPAPIDGGNGLGNLSTRLQAVDGRLSAGIDSDGWFHVTAEAPLTTGRPEQAGSPAATPRSRLRRLLPLPGADALGGNGDSGMWRPRLAFTVTLVVLAGYALIMYINVLDIGPSPAQALGVLACLAAGFALQILHSFRGPRNWPGRRRLLSLAAQALLSYLPLLWLDRPWGSMVGFLSGSVLLAVRDRVRWALYAAIGASVLILSLAAGVSIRYLIYLPVSSLLTGLVVYGISSLSTLVAELYAARDGLARMAVTRERLRVARDLHDLLGYSLSAITLKSELTYRLLPAQPHRAREEVTDILTMARQALADVRTVADGYRAMSLGVEVQSAQSILAAAGIEVRAEVSTPGLPAGVETVLATVLREAITNVLRHSKAQNVTIRATVADGVVRLRVANDGVDRDAPAPIDGGNGLGNLSTRLQAVDGRLSAGIDRDGWFHVTAEAPLTPSPSPAP